LFVCLLLLSTGVCHANELSAESSNSSKSSVKAPKKFSADRLVRLLAKRSISAHVLRSDQISSEIQIDRGQISVVFTLDQFGRLLAARPIGVNAQEVLFHWSEVGKKSRLGIMVRNQDGSLQSPVPDRLVDESAAHRASQKTVSQDDEDDDWWQATQEWQSQEDWYYQNYWGWSGGLPISCSLQSCLDRCGVEYAGSMLACGAIGGVGTTLAGPVGALVGLLCAADMMYQHGKCRDSCFRDCR
jgi:hypothetical protein